MTAIPTPHPPHVLVLFAHPAPQRAPLMRALAAAARELPGVLVQDLYEIYPDFDVDGGRERTLLLDARLVVFLYPVRWYGMPSLMREWMEVTLQPGWAYARAQDGEMRGKLRDKGFWLVTSTGSGPEAYGPDGLHGRPFEDFLPPVEQAARLLGMDWHEPLVMHGAAGIVDGAIEANVDEFRRRLLAHARAHEGERSPGDA